MLPALIAARARRCRYPSSCTCAAANLAVYRGSRGKQLVPLLLPLESLDPLLVHLLGQFRVSFLFLLSRALLLDSFYPALYAKTRPLVSTRSAGGL